VEVVREEWRALIELMIDLKAVPHSPSLRAHSEAIHLGHRKKAGFLFHIHFLVVPKMDCFAMRSQ
jgi:hypothetical protein